MIIDCLIARLLYSCNGVMINIRLFWHCRFFRIFAFSVGGSILLFGASHGLEGFLIVGFFIA